MHHRSGPGRGDRGRRRGDGLPGDQLLGAKLLLVNAKNKIVRTGKADRFGSKIFYDVKPGATFTVRTPSGNGAKGTPRFKVLKPGQNPPQSFYETPDKELHAGLNYITTRDGTELAVTVRLPSGVVSLDQGPFPTFVEYSGYQTAAPHDLLAGVLSGLGGGVTPKDDLAPASSTAVGGLIGLGGLYFLVA